MLRCPVCHSTSTFHPEGYSLASCLNCNNAFRVNAPPSVKLLKVLANASTGKFAGQMTQAAETLVAAEMAKKLPAHT